TVKQVVPGLVPSGVKRRSRLLRIRGSRVRFGGMTDGTRITSGPALVWSPPSRPGTQGGGWSGITQ
ncbi:hypothetical protein CSUI_004840, partial [Cystoisospora suis]